MIINTNMASLNTIRQLGINEKNTQTSLAKLSSGLRINTAADDAAGLAISEKMRGQISGLNQASSNAQNGISMVSTAEGALNETTSILQRMRELAVQAANDTNTSDDRQQIQAEMNQLTSEVNRIGNTTEFNTQKLLKGITAPVVETALSKTTVTAGIAGVAAGNVSALSVDTSSVKEADSQATVQASRADATGSVSKMRTTTSSTKGALSSVTLANGVVFQSKTMGTELNDRKIVIEQGAAAGTATTVNYANYTYTFTVGQTAGGVSLASNRGELYNELNKAMQNGTGDPTQDAEIAKLSLVQPANTDTAVTNVAANGTMANGRAEINGAYEFDMTNEFDEAGDTITIGDQTFKSVLNNATAANGEFAVGVQTQLTGGNAVSAADLSSVTGDVTINVAGRDFKISQDSLRKVTTGGAAVWDTGAMTAMTAGQNGTFVFNGVTVNITAAAAAGGTGTIDLTNKTVDLAINSGGGLAAQMGQLQAALAAYKGAAGSTDFANYTFAVNGNSDGISITNSNNGISDLAITTTGNVTITNAGSTAQQTDNDGNDDGVLGVGNSIGDLMTVINDATDNDGIKLSTVADVAQKGSTGELQITAKESQAAAITWTANGDITNKQLINEAFGINTIAKLDSNDRVEPTADLNGIQASWDTGDIDISALANGDQASYTFGGVTVIVHATDTAGLGGATGTDGSALNFNDTSLQAGDSNAVIDVLSNSTVHMYFDRSVGAADGVAKSASFADNLAAAFNAAKYYNSATGDVDGTGSGALANFTITDEKGTQDDTVAAGINMGRLVFTDSEADGDSNNAYQINATTLGAGQGTIAKTTTATQQQAVWDSGDITAVATGDTKTLTFGGVTVNITGVATADLAGANATVNAKYDVSNNTINLTIDTSVANTAGLFATALGTALNDAKTKVPLSSTDFNNFTFAGAAGTTGAAATSGHLTITRDSGEALQSTYEIGGTLNIGYVGGATQTSTGAGRAGMKGTDSISSDTSATFTVDGHDYTISNIDLKNAFNETKGANTPADILNLVSTRALDSNGNALSTVASVTMDANNGLVVTSLTEGDSSNVKFTVNGTSGTDQVERALGISDGSNDGGESAVSESKSVTSQGDSLVNAINANAVLGARFTAVNNGGTITLTEKTDQATGVNLSSAVVAGAGSDDKLIATNTEGKNLKTITIQQAVTTGNVAAASNKIDNTFQLTASAGGSDTFGGGTELNGLKVAFSGLTSGASTAITATFDADTFQINVTGTLESAPGNQADIASKIQTAINNELTANGFGTTIKATQGATAGNSAGVLAAYNGKVMEFGKAGDDNAVKGQVAIASNDTMVVSQTNGNLTINLANTNAYKNTADAIQQAVQALGTTGYTAGTDFSKYEFTTQGNWDSSTLGNSIKKSTAALVGGTEEVKGSYSFDVTKSLQSGDIVDVAGTAFKAVAKNPNIANHEFQVVAGDTLADQAVRLADAVGSAFSGYTVTTQGSKIIMTQNVGDGVDMSEKDLSVRATGTQGNYTVAMDEVLTNGAKFVLDGQEITVSDKNENTGYDNGTAVKQAATVADQTKAIADAINSNASLKNKYTASVAADGSLDLKQSELYASATAPVVSTKSTDKGDFQATFQVGANSGQTMAIDFKDMRSEALGISGDGSTSTVKAGDGSQASYVSIANVTNGTDDNNVEYALDVSTADKATAAISVINDAINAVSTERAKMGAYQNRLEHTINNLGTASQNITSAEANIRDVDMAAEMTNFQKNNILQQAAQAMLAQANQQPQGVLQLLR